MEVRKTQLEPAERFMFLTELIFLYYQYHATGGNLHVVLDDGNLNIDSVLFCLERAREAGDFEGEAIAKRLLELSEAQRELMYAHEYSKNGWHYRWGSGKIIDQA